MPLHLVTACNAALNSMRCCDVASAVNLQQVQLHQVQSIVDGQVSSGSRGWSWWSWWSGLISVCEGAAAAAPVQAPVHFMGITPG